MLSIAAYNIGGGPPSQNPIVISYDAPKFADINKTLKKENACYVDVDEYFVNVDEYFIVDDNFYVLRITL